MASLDYQKLQYSIFGFIKRSSENAFQEKAFGFCYTITIQKSILKRKGTISLKASDLFNTSIWKYENFRDTFRTEGEGMWREPTHILTFNTC